MVDCTCYDLHLRKKTENTIFEIYVTCFAPAIGVCVFSETKTSFPASYT